MIFKTKEINGVKITLINSKDKLIKDAQSALDLMASVQYETGSNHIAVNKEAISEDFFSLKTCLAGDILQKFINYKVKFAIIGDFSYYTSKALKDFIYECNSGRDIFFLSSENEALEKFSCL